MEHATLFLATVIAFNVRGNKQRKGVIHEKRCRQAE